MTLEHYYKNSIKDISCFRGTQLGYLVVGFIYGKILGGLIWYLHRYFMLHWYKRENDKYSDCNLLKVNNLWDFLRNKCETKIKNCLRESNPLK